MSDLVEAAHGGDLEIGGACIAALIRREVDAYADAGGILAFEALLIHRRLHTKD